MSGRLVLVASYPRSGNTWTRAVLEHLKRGADWKFSINNLPTGFYGFSRRVLFDMVSPISASDLFPDEIDDMLPDLFRAVAEENPGTHIVKVHDEAYRTRSGNWLYPPDAVHTVIYVVRHPFDVAVSFANHMDMSLADAVATMADRNAFSPATYELPMPLPQRIGSWSSNIDSWLGEAPHRVSLVRYEDLHADPVGAFHRLAEMTGFQATHDDIQRAVAGTEFTAMQGEESASGFRQRPRSSAQFFRAGRPRNWEGVLDAALCEQIVSDHGPAMARLGYFPDGSVGAPSVEIAS